MNSQTNNLFCNLKIIDTGDKKIFCPFRAELGNALDSLHTQA